MQVPICELCLSSKSLCNSCQEKLDKREINELEIKISRFLYNLSEKVRSLRNIKITKVVDCGVLLIVSGRGDAAKLVGKNGAIVKKIAKKFNKSIRILEEAPNFKDFVEGLTSPATISGINTLYRDNEELYRIRIPMVQRSHLLIPPEDFPQILSDFYKIKAELVFE